MSFRHSLPHSPDLPYAETMHRGPAASGSHLYSGLDPTRGPSRVQTTAKLTQHLIYLFPSGSCHLGASCWENPPPFCQLSLCIYEQVNLLPALLGRCIVPSFRNTVICHLSFLQNWWGTCFLVTSVCSCSTSLGVKRTDSCWCSCHLSAWTCLQNLGGCLQEESKYVRMCILLVTHTVTQSHMCTHTHTPVCNIIGEV